MLSQMVECDWQGNTIIDLADPYDGFNLAQMSAPPPSTVFHA